MRNDNISKIPDNYLGLGNSIGKFKYNNYDFTLETTRKAAARSTNSHAVQRQDLNYEANIRKRVLGIGLGQHLPVANMATAENGEVVLKVSMEGSSYSIPISVNDRNEYRHPFSKREFNSMKDVALHVMDGLFREKKIDNEYDQVRQAPVGIPAPGRTGLRF